MSVPKKETTWGEVLYEGKKYGVLYGFHLGKEIEEKLGEHIGGKIWMGSTALWATVKVEWSIEGDKLYLTKLLTDGTMKKLLGRKRILADWVDELELLVEHRRICKTYEKRGSYINEIKTLRLTFNQGKLIDVSEKTELYRSIEMRNYIDRNSAYATLRIDSRDLLDYVDNKESRPSEDQLFPPLLNMLDQMLKEGGKNDINLGIEDLKNVLKEGDHSVLASVKGSNIDEILDSLVDSMTDNGLLKMKSCLLHLTMNDNYPISSVKKIVDYIERKLDIDESPFYFGTQLSNELVEDEILIRILVSI